MILAIIAVIATPIITGIIEDSKKASFERSAEGVVEATKFDITDKLTDNGYTYNIVDGIIEGLNENIKISNSKGINGTISYNKEGEVSYAIHNDKWCVVKKNNEVTTSDYNGECVLATPSSCFTYEEVENGISITGYRLNDEITTTVDLDNMEVGDNCVNFFVTNGLSEEEATTNCSKEYIINMIQNATSSGNSVSDVINELQYFNIIKNAIVKQELLPGGGLDVVIPSTIDGKTVVAIGDYVFFNNQLTSIEIPESVINIGDAAFRNNQLTSVTIPDSVTTIETLAFAFNQLTSITIPSSVTSIGGRAFESNQLTSVEIPESVTSIGEYSFAFNQLTSITIPSSVTSIGLNAFYKTSDSNPNLTKIINKTGKSFEWAYIVKGLRGYSENEFVTGTVENSIGNVEITSE